MDPLKLTYSQQLWLHSSVGGALHRYRRGHGFESRWSMNFFFRLLFHNCLNCVSTAKIFHNVITHNRGTNPVTIMLYYPYWHDGPTKIWPTSNSYGFIAQLVEHCTGIAEVTGSNPAEAWNFFFRLLVRNCLNCVSTAKIFHNVITHNRGTNPVTIMLYYP